MTLKKASNRWRRTSFPVIWEIPDLKAVTQRTGVGGYTVKMTSEGVKDGVVARGFRRDGFAWEGFKGGTSDTVPSMFTPVEETRTGPFGLWGDKIVKTVLREHVVDADTGLWKQVVAAGKPQHRRRPDGSRKI